jgi:hypothetical protein
VQTTKAAAVVVDVTTTPAAPIEQPAPIERPAPIPPVAPVEQPAPIEQPAPAAPAEVVYPVHPATQAAATSDLASTGFPVAATIAGGLILIGAGTATALAGRRKRPNVT